MSPLAPALQAAAPSASAATAGRKVSFVDRVMPALVRPSKAGRSRGRKRSEDEECGRDPGENETARQPDHAEGLVALLVVHEPLRVGRAVDPVGELAVRRVGLL